MKCACGNEIRNLPEYMQDLAEVVTCEACQRRVEHENAERLARYRLTHKEKYAPVVSKANEAIDYIVFRGEQPPQDMETNESRRTG